MLSRWRYWLDLYPVMVDATVHFLRDNGHDAVPCSRIEGRQGVPDLRCEFRLQECLFTAQEPQTLRGGGSRSIESNPSTYVVEDVPDAGHGAPMQPVHLRACVA